MPRTYTTEEAQERYEKLPDALKDAIFSTEVAEKIFETGKKNGLTIEKIGFLAEETGRVILGLTRPQEFVPLLADRLGAPTDTAQKIASDINHQIFFPLREILKSAHQMEMGESAIQKPPAVDLRSVARPAAAAPPSPPVAPQGTAKVPPIDLRKQEQRARPPLVDVGGQKAPVPASLPADFLTREEVAKVVREQRVTPPTPKPPVAQAPKPPEVKPVAPKPDLPVKPVAPPAAKALTTMDPIFPQPVSPKVPPIDLRKQPSPLSSPSYPQAPSPSSPQSSPLAVPLPMLRDVEGTIPSPVIPRPFVPPPSKTAVSATEPQTIDLREGRDISLDFRPPPAPSPRPTPPTTEKPKAPLPSPTSSAPSPAPFPQPPSSPKPPAPHPAVKQEAPPPQRPATASSSTVPSKIPPIDLRREPQPPMSPPPPKTKPWSGSDPYREPLE